MFQNLWDAAKAVLKGIFIALSACIRKEGRSKINQLIYLKKLEKDQIKMNVSRRKEIVSIRAEIHKIENKNSVEKINNTQTCSLKRSIKSISL